MKARLFILRDKRGRRCLTILVAAVLLCSLCSPISWSIENPAVQNPAGISTVPPSSIRSGLVSTPDQIDTSGNLVVTGNVRRGSHFRGAVPYQSTTSLSAGLGSSSLSSFLRDSAGSQDFGGYSGSYGLQPYYSPTETATTMAPGRSGVLRPSGTGIDGRVGNDMLSTGTDVFGLEALPGKSVTSGYVRDTSTYDLSSQPQEIQHRALTEPQSTSLSPRGTELLVTDEIDLRPQGEKSVIEQYQEQMGRTPDTAENAWDPELFQRNLQRAREQSAQWKQNLTGQDESLELSRQNRVNGTIQSDNLGRLGQNEGVFDLKVPEEQTSRVPTVPYPLPVSDEYMPVTERDDFMERQSPSVNGDMQYSQPDTVDKSRSDVLENMQRQLNDLARTIENASGGSGRREAGGTELISLQQMVDSRQSQRSYENQTTDLDQLISELSNRPSSSSVVAEENGLEFPQVQSRENSQNRTSALEELEGLSQAELSAEAERIMGPHKTLDSFSKAKFTKHFMAAQRYLQMGEYYRASHSFTLASTYKPDDPYSLAGKGYALFAAGEYVSSALFISRALELAPVYMRVDVDLMAIMGGDDKLQSRIAEVEEWLARSGSAQLGFLLGYVCYRTGDLDRAKLAIEAAYVKIPQSQSVLAVREAVDEKLKTRQ